MSDIFIDSSRSNLDLAGVIEVDSETAYFYLFATEHAESPGVLAAIDLGSQFCSKLEDAFDIKWSENEEVVSALIEGEVYAAFETRSEPGKKLTIIKVERPKH